jgi:Leucine-rich repeat (LRR) protein
MLDISRNKYITLEGLKYFKMPRLYVLKAGNNHIRTISGISHLTSLRDIDLSANRIKTVET